MFTLVVKDLYSSYKDLPLSIYQIQTKYRDEARPRAGLLRGREFVMKDSYSFDVDDAGLEASYQAHRDAYIRIFDRLGFEYVIVKATSGAMGGSRSEEFLANAAVGEDTYVRCTACDYAANVEAVQVRPPSPVAYDDAPAAHAEDTPDTPTIETLVAHLNAAFPRDDRPWAAGDTLKNVLVVLKHPDGTREPLAIGLPGDRDVDQKRLEGQLEPIEVEPMDEAAMARHPALVKGYIGPARARREDRVRHPLPRRPAGRRGHPLGDRRQRPRQPRHRPGRRARLHARRHHRGRRGPRRRPLPQLRLRACSSRPAASRWATSSSSAASTPTRWTSRSSTRTASSSRSPWAPTASARRGPWPPSPRARSTSSASAGRATSSPYDVHLVATGKDEEVFAAGERVAHELSAQGIAVLYDDRPGRVSPGVKFKDAELIGVPTIVVVGKGLADGTIEVKDRATGERENVPADRVVDHLVRLVRA